MAQALGVPYEELFPPHIYADEVEEEAPTKAVAPQRLTLCDETDVCSGSLGESGMNIVQLGNGRVRLLIQQEMSCEKALDLLVRMRA